MLDYARFYYLYNSVFTKAARIIIFVALGIAVLSFTLKQESFNTSLFLFSIFLMFETFFHFKLAKVAPKKITKVTKDNLPILESFTLEAIKPFVDDGSIEKTIKFLLNKMQVVFILEKASIDKKEIGFVDIDKNTLAEASFQTAQKLNARYVTTMDVLASYLLLSEGTTKLLFNKNLKKDDLLNILYWARNANPGEEKKGQKTVFWGKGVGEDWITGWTPETEKYVWDITSDVLAQKPFLLGRKEEYKQVKEAMYRGKSVILVGEPGSGKTALMHALAYESFVGSLKGTLYHQRVFQLLVDALIAGAKNQGELEERVDSIIEEVAHANNIIIFIPNIENILGSATFGLDLSGVLIPYLKRHFIRIISTATPASFKKFVEPEGSLLDVFEIVRFEESDKDIALKMLLERTLQIEKKNHVTISYKAVIEAFDLSRDYLPSRVKPGSTVRLLEDTVAEVVMSGRRNIQAQDVKNKVRSKTKIPVGEPDVKEKELLLHLEDKMHKFIIDQKDAILAVSEGLRRIRAELSERKKPISFLFLGPTGVGKTLTAKTFSSLYFGEDRMIRVDMSEYGATDSAKRLLGGLPDEEGFTDKVYNQPFSSILLDEFEKGATNVIDLFLQVLQDGRLTDNKGKTVSFVNTIITATSNAGSEFIREELEKGAVVDKAFRAKLLDFLQEKGIFKPELLNRFDDIIVFKPLGMEEVDKITRLMLEDLSKKLLEKDIVVSFDDKIVAKIVKEGFDKEFGARPIRRFIQDNIEDLIAKKILKDEIKRGNKIAFSVDNANTITVGVS